MESHRDDGAILMSSEERSNVNPTSNTIATQIAKLLF